MRFIEECYLNKEWSNYSNYKIALASTWNEELINMEDKLSEESSLISKSLEHRKMAIRVARESIVLLKNDNKLLPLREDIKTIAVIGERANIHNSHKKISDGVKSLYEVTPLLGIKMKFGVNTEIKWAKGYSKNLSEKEKLFNEAMDIARNSDVVIFVGGDRDNRGDSELEYQNYLIKKLSSINKNIVVVVAAGLSNKMVSWIDEVDTVIQTWYDGMEYGTALVEVLLGDVNPSGKVPIVLSEVKTKFSFGYGLSYTTFKYSDLKISLDEKKADMSMNIKFNLTNVGKVAGAEVCEVYMNNKKALEEKTNMNLVGIKKIYLEPSETKKVEINLDRKLLTTYSVYKGSFAYKEGDFEILIGSSLNDIRLKDEIHIKSNYKYSWNFSLSI